MAVERTLSIIKPDATRRNLTGEIVSRFEKAGLRVIAQRRMRLSRPQAEAFYAVHRERPFFNGLVEFMISGPVVVQVLEAEHRLYPLALRLTAERRARLENGRVVFRDCPSTDGILQNPAG